MTFLALLAIAGIAIPLGERSFLPYAHAARNLPALGSTAPSPHTSPSSASCSASGENTSSSY